MLNKLRSLALLIVLLLAACAPAAPRPTVLVVMAAASLTAPFEEIGARFEAEHPGVRVEFNFAGSQQLAQQIAEGAPAAVFASANQQQMDAVIATGQIEPGSARPFATNRLVVVYPKDNPARLNLLADLARPGLKLVLAAPEVPVGQYTLDFIDQAAADMALGKAFRAGVLANVASYETNVKAVLSKVALGEADAGIVYASDVDGAVRERIGQIEIPPALNVRAAYLIAPLAAAPDGALAMSFIEFILSEPGWQILAAHGFAPAP